jgi:hypothetical protein
MNSTVVLSVPAKIYDDKGNMVGSCQGMTLVFEDENMEFGDIKIINSAGSYTVSLKDFKPVTNPSFPKPIIFTDEEGILITITPDLIYDQQDIVLSLNAKFKMTVTNDFLEYASSPDAYIAGEFINTVSKKIAEAFKGFDKKEVKHPLKPTQSAASATWNMLKKLFPGVVDSSVTCPAKCSREVNVGGGEEIKIHKSDIYSMIQHLNDEHTWSREQIADWLETTDANITLKGGLDVNT